VEGVNKHDPNVIIFVLNDGYETKQICQFFNGETTVFGYSYGLQMTKGHVHVEEFAL